MAILKKNIVSLIFGVIALVAVIASFYPLSGEFEALQTDLETSGKRFQEADSILKKQRTLPQVKLTTTEEARPLTVFPAPKITRMTKGFMDGLISQSRGVLEAAVIINLHECMHGTNQAAVQKADQGWADAQARFEKDRRDAEARKDDGKVRDAERARDDALWKYVEALRVATLLVPNSLPESSADGDNQFKRALAPEYDRLRTKVLDGAFPPTPEELKKAEDEVKVAQEKNLVPGLNEAQIQKAIEDEQAALPNKMRTDVANKHHIYVDADAITVPRDVIMAPQSPRPDQIWLAQVTLWAQEDVCRAIAETNRSAKNVQDAPVKRLVSLTVPPAWAMYLRPAVDPAAAAAAPDVTGRGGATAIDTSGGGATNAEPKPTYSLTPTGRTCNSMYDVVNVTLVVHVDQTQLPMLLKQLAMNRFITVRKVDFRRLDVKDLTQQNFVYGNAPIAEVALDLEMLQLREWTVRCMPKVAKDTLIGSGVEYTFQIKPPEKAQ